MCFVFFNRLYLNAGQSSDNVGYRELWLEIAGELKIHTHGFTGLEFLKLDGKKSDHNSWKQKTVTCSAELIQTLLSLTNWATIFYLSVGKS